MTPFKNQSSFLAGCEYEKDGGILTVHFKNGKEYKYGSVSFDEYNEFLNAESPGEAFANIKKNFKPYVGPDND